MRDAPSPNFNARAEGAAMRYIVLHYTGMPTAEEALFRLTDAGSEVSAHYMIDEDGEVIRLVDESLRAWHAGKSCWQEERDMNSASIGIELVNPGHAFGYRPFPQAQIDALKVLLHEIIARYDLLPSCLLAHSDIAPTRKEDPGELFPWKELAQEKLGLWPQPTPHDYEPERVPSEVFFLLTKIGYDCPPMDEAACYAALQAFQRHYHPEALMDEITPETLARLRALVREIG